MRYMPAHHLHILILPHVPIWLPQTMRSLSVWGGQYKHNCPTQPSKDTSLASTSGGMKLTASDWTDRLRPKRDSWVQSTTGQWPFYSILPLALKGLVQKKHHLRATLVQPTVNACQAVRSAQHVPRR